MADFDKCLIPSHSPVEKGVALRYDETFGNFIPFNPKVRVMNTLRMNCHPPIVRQIFLGPPLPMTYFGKEL
jgi:hypothetical protein